MRPVPSHELSSSLVLSSLELNDTQDYEPQIRALLGTASHFSEVVVLIVRSMHSARWTRVGNGVAQGSDVGQIMEKLDVGGRTDAGVRTPHTRIRRSVADSASEVCGQRYKLLMWVCQTISPLFFAGRVAGWDIVRAPYNTSSGRGHVNSLT